MMEHTIQLTDEEIWALAPAVFNQMKLLSEQSPSSKRDRQMHALRSFTEKILPYLEQGITDLKDRSN